ncbi:MAG TPA: histidine kinase [Candidatus Dormibacteraeota bacterium]|nr:histidine kinase [Candidatus Dormibacteraeota bacterium]
MQNPHATNRKSFGYPGPLTHLAVWTFVGLLAYGRHMLQLTGQVTTKIDWPELFMWMSCFMPAALFGPLIFKLERRYPLGKLWWLRNAAVLGVGGLVFAYVACQVGTGICIAVAYCFRLPLIFPRPLWAVESGELAIQFFLFWFVVASSYVFRHFMKLQNGERERTELLLEKSRLEASLKHAELEALRMRLNPHFLFNTLQNISILTQQDPRVASQMLTRLGDLLRVAIRSGSEQETDLATEIRLTEAYASMEKMRFADRLHIVFEIAPETSQATVPTLLLQPLLENAIKHGLRGVAREGFIAIRSRKEKDQLVLAVTDNGVGPADGALGNNEGGIGLGATRQRLDRLYPGANELSLSKSLAGGTEVRVVLPFRSLAATMERHDPVALAHC